MGYEAGAPVTGVHNTLARYANRSDVVSQFIGWVSGLVRNSLALNSMTEWQILKQSALNLLTLVLLFHRKPDRTV